MTRIERQGASAVTPGRHGPVASYLALCRKRKKLSQSGLDALIGTPRGTVAQWEMGRMYPDYPRCGKLATVLQIDANDLWVMSAAMRDPEVFAAGGGTAQLVREVADLRVEVQRLRAAISAVQAALHELQ